MSAHTILTCDALCGARRCAGKTVVFHTCIVSFARELASRKGWATRTSPFGGELLDLCPECAPRKAPVRRHEPGDGCSQGSACQVLGHDWIGHRVTNILSALGLTLEEAETLAHSELFKIAGLGPTGIKRLKSRLKPPA